MKITSSVEAVKRIMTRKHTLRVLSLFFVTKQLDPPDIINITGLGPTRVAEALGDLILAHLIVSSRTNNPIFTRNTKDYYYLMPENENFSWGIVKSTLEQEEFKLDKAKIESLLSKEEIRGFFK
jgi:hypothetical protein